MGSKSKTYLPIKVQKHFEKVRSQVGLFFIFVYLMLLDPDLENLKHCGFDFYPDPKH
jgi:hypothetical protein